MNDYACLRCGGSFSLPLGMTCDDHHPVPINVEMTHEEGCVCVGCVLVNVSAERDRYRNALALIASVRHPCVMCGASRANDDATGAIPHESWCARFIAMGALES